MNDVLVPCLLSPEPCKKLKLSVMPVFPQVTYSPSPIRRCPPGNDQIALLPDYSPNLQVHYFPRVLVVQKARRISGGVHDRLSSILEELVKARQETSPRDHPQRTAGRSVQPTKLTSHRSPTPTA
jgi:hypothetical protein